MKGSSVIITDKIRNLMLFLIIMSSHGNLEGVLVGKPMLSSDVTYFFDAGQFV